MGAFSELWKRMTSGATRRATKAATQEVADKVGAVADSVLDDAEAVLEERRKQQAERHDGLVLPSTAVDDPDWVQQVRDTEAAQRKRQVPPEPSTEPQQSAPQPEVPGGPTAEERARSKLARLKREMLDGEE
jgi:hypothetical protein